MEILNKQQHAQYFRISYLYYLRNNQYIPFLRVSLCANIERWLAQQFCQKLLRYTCLLGRSLYCTLSADIQLWQTTTFFIQHILKYPYLQQLMCSVYLKGHWWTQRRMLEVHKQTLKLLLGVMGNLTECSRIEVIETIQLLYCVCFTSTQYMFPFGFLCTRNWFGMHVCPLTPYFTATSTLFILFRDNFSLHALYL